MMKLVLGAVGDIALDGEAEELLRLHGPEYLFERARDSLRAADVLFGNLESVILPEDYPRDKISRHALFGPDAVWKILKASGFDVLNQAANHALDCGRRGLLYTNRRIRDAGAQPLGAGETPEDARAMRVVRKKGMRVGFLGYLEPSNWTLEGGGGRVAYFKLPRVIEDIRRNRTDVDVLVVSVHAGLEFRPGPSIPRVEACRKVAEAGADVVLCHHPHVPQGVERWGESVIAYSLGNFAFRATSYLKSNSLDVLRAHVFFVDIEDGKIVGWRREYFRLDEKENRPVPLTGEEAAREKIHYEALDTIVADAKRLREIWYESCRLYLAQYWKSLTEAGPEGFIERSGWRVLGNDESANWVTGILELARTEYEKNAHGDFEFVCPNSPFMKSPPEPLDSRAFRSRLSKLLAALKNFLK